jgi:DNA-binding NarL/FixJ family response regulator
MPMASADSGDTTPSQRVVIVDMDRRVRGALAELLDVGGAKVVGTAGDSSAAMALLDDEVDIMVVDPRLPDLADGHALVSAIARDWPKVKVVIIGWSDSAGDSRLQEQGATFVAKTTRSDEFAAAILKTCGCPDLP